MKRERLSEVQIKLAMVLAASTLSSVTANADRLVLGPAGGTATELSWNSQFAISRSGLSDYTWASYSSADGIETEIVRQESQDDRKKRWAANFAYPLPTLRDLPALTFGVRDLGCTGSEHGSAYLAGSKSLRVMGSRGGILKSVSLSGGVGTGAIGGLFGGVALHFTHGPSLSAEVYRHRLNATAAFPLVKNLRVQALMLNGQVYYGASYSFVR